MPDMQPKPENKNTDEILGIQYLRGLAAIAVAAFHLSLAQNQFFPNEDPLIPVIYGLWGVDLFFIISGFIMVYVTANQTGTLRSVMGYWKNRVVRIVPAYWVFTFAAFFLTYLLSRYTSSIKPYDMESLLRSLFFIEINRFPVLIVGWTLSYEMFFYLVFGLAMLVWHEYRAFIVAGIFIAFISIGLIGDWRDSPIKFITSPIILEFTFGLFLGWAYQKKTLGGVALGWALVILSMVIMLWAFRSYDHTYLLDNRTIFWGVPSALLMWGVVVIGCEWRYPALLFLGNISYGIYLSHVPVIMALVVILRDIQVSHINSNTILVLATIPFTIIIAAVSYYLIERPLCGWFRKS